MKTRHFTTIVRLLGLLAGLGITLAQAQTTLYADDFSGSSATDLNSQAPDTRPGTQTWSTSTVASSWKADGSMEVNNQLGDGMRNAYLPFTPETGKIYTLSMTVDVTAGGSNWFALGFTDTSSTGTTSETFGQFQQQGATAWMLERANAETVTFEGPNTAGSTATYGSTDAPKTLKIVLDTTTALWTVDFFRDDVFLGDFTYGTNPTINNVAIGKFANASGTVDNFSLTVETPNQTPIYQDNFSGLASTDLNGQAPDTRPSTETWSTSTTPEAWKADGSMAADFLSRNAFLPFTPVSGNIYTLSMTVDVTSGGGDWFALGFTNFSNTGTADQFQQQGATAWMLERAAAETLSFTGPETAGGETYTSTEGPKNLKIVLDTTTALWTVDFFRDGVLLREFTYSANPTINYVAFGKFDTAAGTVDNFSLTVATQAQIDLVLMITQNGGALDFEWNSLPGKQYDLLTSTDLATPIASWPVYNDGVTTYENIPASGGAITTLTGVLKLGSVRFFALREE